MQLYQLTERLMKPPIEQQSMYLSGQCNFYVLHIQEVGYVLRHLNDAY